MQVYIIGAGPGDPDLLTIKGKKVMKEAEVIIYAGSLVNQEILKYSPGAEIYNSAEMDLEEIIEVIEKSVQEGKTVARIHTGDPSLYGAIQEQIDLLEQKNIKYQIIPGVSSFLAAAAAVKREFTLPDVSQTVILTRREGRTSVPEREKLDKLAEHRSSMAIFLSIQMIEEVVADLLREYPKNTPVAVVEKASWEEEQVLTGKLSSITTKVEEAGIKKTAMILVGEFLDTDYSRSQLYDKDFSHGYREGEKINKAILVVSFGTSYAETRRKTIKACEDRIAEEFLDYDIERAFTSGIIIDKLKEKDGIPINNPGQALEELYNKGYQEVLVQPLHIINGNEYHDLVETVNKFKTHFKDLKVSSPLLTKTEDYFKVVQVLSNKLPETDSGEAVILMGHGSVHPANSAYPCLDFVFKDKGFNNYYVGTVEGYPELKQIIPKLKEKKIEKVHLAPLMLVAGDHAQKDMAGEEDDSWKNILEKEGLEVEVHLTGLGEYEGIQELFVEKVQDLRGS